MSDGLDSGIFKSSSGDSSVELRLKPTGLAQWKHFIAMEGVNPTGTNPMQWQSGHL